MQFIKPRLLKLSSIIVFLFFGLLLTAQVGGFKYAQMKNAKVKEAYKQKWDSLKIALKAKGLTANFDLLVRAYKMEKKLEVWIKNKPDKVYKLFRTYDICATSGTPGPKRKEGDGQIPEGFYTFDLYNPNSEYYLSLRVSYPNHSDKVLGDKKSPGGAIMVHGNCVTIGCIPITDDKIKELYILAVEVKNNGGEVPIDIFPCYLTDANMKKLEKENKPELMPFWKNLKEAYDYFVKNSTNPAIHSDKTGTYIYSDKD
jgi:murein L,D-transpeptidase YafK